MAWPPRTLTSEGFKEYKSPIENIKGHGPHDWEKGWRAHTGQTYEPGIYEEDDEDDENVVVRREESGLSYWGIKGNPIFEHAAKAKGIDWDAFINTFSDATTYNLMKGEAVTRWNEETLRHRGAVKASTHYGREGQTSTTYTPYETPAPHKERYGLDQRISGSEELMRQMYTMNKFIWDSVKDWKKKYDAPIIEEGPTSEQYGLPKGTDPWEFYGLDKVPRILPKALDVDYQLNLNDAFASGAAYRTPKGYPGIDLDSVEPAKIGDAFWEYKEDFDFAQEHGYWDYDIGSGGDPKYKDELKFIFGDAHDDIRIFGQKDYDALVDQGLDKEGVRDIINARLKSGQKLILGPAMAEHFDMYSYDPGWWGQPSGTLGQKGVRLLRLQGLDDAGIMSRYAKGLHGSKIGPWVQENFGIRIWPETGMYDYYFMDPGDKRAFGMKDYNQFLDQGMDPKRIKQIAKELTSVGWTLGPEAAELMGLRGYQAGSEVEANGGYLNGEIFNTYQATGWDNDKLMELALSDKTTLIGWEAAEKLFGWKDKGDIGSFGMKDITENWPDGPTDRPDRVTLGKIAGGVADTIGPSAADYIWGNELYDIHMTPPVGAKPDAFTFGKDAINYLRNHPTNPVRNNKTIAAIARGAPYIGVEAATELGMPARQAPIEKKTLQQVLSTPISEYDKPDLIGKELGGFGQQEIDWMETAKWTPDQMRAVTENFDRIGPEAAKYLWGAQLIARMPAPANAVDPSKTTFGMDTIKYLDAADPQISDKSIAAIARGAADYVGEGALEWFEERGIDVGKGSAPLNAPRPRPAPTPQEPSRPAWVDQGDQGAFGMQDVNWLSSKGYSDDEMRSIAARTNRIGADAARKLWSYTDPGDRGYFGQADYDQLKRNGASDDIMRRIIRGMNLQLGDKYKWLG